MRPAGQPDKDTNLGIIRKPNEPPPGQPETELDTDHEYPGKRTQIALREGGAALNMGDPADDDLPKVVEDLTGLQGEIQELTKAELGVSVGHRLWQYTAMAAVVHLMSNKLYGIADLQGLPNLQKQHIAWVANRIPEHTEMDVAALP